MGSKRNIRRKQCGQKIRHATQAAAWAHISHLKRSGKDGHLRPYRCPWCGQWHVGNVTESVFSRTS